MNYNSLLAEKREDWICLHSRDKLPHSEGVSKLTTNFSFIANFMYTYSYYIKLFHHPQNNFGFSANFLSYKLHILFIYHVALCTS